MQLCTACNEFSVSEFYDSYDNEIYRRCRICGKIQDEPQSETTIETTEKEIYRKE